MKANKTYYVYRHLRLDTNEVFYIGIGTKSSKYTEITEYYRAYSRHYRNAFWYSVTKKTDYIVEILFETEDHLLVQQKEIEFIKLYGRRNLGIGTLVNLNDGGGCNTNMIVSQETRKKQSIAKKGIPRISQAHKDKLRELYKGIRPCLLAQENAFKAKLKPISQFTLEGEWIRDFDSIKEASEALKLKSHSSISLVLTNKHKSCKGFNWKYK